MNVAANRFERLARRIGLPLVVAGDDPDLAVPLDADLRRPEDVARVDGMDAHAADRERLAVRDRLDGGVGQPPPEHRSPGAAHRYAPRPRRRMVAVRVRDEGAIDGLPGIDVEAARLTEEAR